MISHDSFLTSIQLPPTARPPLGACFSFVAIAPRLWKRLLTLTRYAQNLPYTPPTARPPLGACFSFVAAAPRLLSASNCMCFSFVLCITTIPLCYIILINHDSLLASTSAWASISAWASYYTFNNTINMIYLIIILFLGILTTSWNLTLFHLYDRIFMNKYEEMMIDIAWYDNNNWYHTYKNTIYPYNVNDIIILCYS